MDTPPHQQQVVYGLPATGETLTVEDLEYWYNRELLEETIDLPSASGVSNLILEDIIHGIKVVYLENYSLGLDSYTLSPRTKEAIESAKETYYKYILLPSLISSNNEKGKKLKVETRSRKRHQFRTMKRESAYNKKVWGRRVC